MLCHTINAVCCVQSVRDTLFDVSSLRGIYPQCFLRSGDDSYTFVGDWDAVEVRSGAPQRLNMLIFSSADVV